MPSGRGIGFRVWRIGCNYPPVWRLLGLNLSSKIMKYCLLLLACVAFLSACKESTAPDGSNTIAGLVVLYDSTGFAADSSEIALTDFSGVTISIDGTTHKTVTDHDGRFEFDNIPNGTYDISATCTLGAFHWYEVQLVGGRLDLSQASFGRLHRAVPILRLGYQPVYSDQYFPLVSNVRAKRYWVAYYCDRDSISSPESPHLAALPAGYVLSPGDQPGAFMYNDLRAAGIHKGDTIYFTCSCVFGGICGSYYDPRYRQTRYSSCGPRSNVVMGVMP